MIESDGAVLYASFGRNATRRGAPREAVKAVNTLEVIRNGGSKVSRPPHFPLERGDRVRIVTGGGGGWGDPKARDLAAVALDVADGSLSVEAAGRIFAVRNWRRWRN